jgi:uncharacterized membrane protein SpoIIM required for sporulation
VILDLQAFIAGEQKHWSELEAVLDRLDQDPRRRMELSEIRRFHYLYERASSAIERIGTFASEPELRRRLEGLVARAYAEIHSKVEAPRKFSPWRWLAVVFPQTFRRRWRAFAMSAAATLAGFVFGAGALVVDPEAKQAIMPFSHLKGDPVRRVAREEKASSDRLAGDRGKFAAFLMTHNIQVSILVFSLGMTWGLGTLVVLFHNGVILGAVALDYARSGQTSFLLGWLLPHGTVEISAILIAGQAGLVLAGALIGRGDRQPLGVRLRGVSGDAMTLVAGMALLLVWAGIVESFLSQYHEPVIPYAAKIVFGVAELAALGAFLAFAGRRSPSPEEAGP